MGMFDQVLADCVYCNNPIYFQSKVADCNFTTYDINNVPIRIAEDLHDDTIQCENCKELNTFQNPLLIKNICCFLTKEVKD